MNFEYSASRSSEATHIYARVPTSTHTHTHSHTHTHTHKHACAYIHKQGVTLHILVYRISSESVVYHHSHVSPDGATAPVPVTNFLNRCDAWRAHLIRSITRALLLQFMLLYEQIL